MAGGCLASMVGTRAPGIGGELGVIGGRIGRDRIHRNRTEVVSSRYSG